MTTPETGGGALQSLEPNADVKIGVRRADGKFVALPVQPLQADAAPEASDALRSRCASR